MKRIITKPPIPILWIDTWFVIDITKAISGEKSQIGKENAEKIFDKVVSLTRQKKLICPEGDQGIEIEDGGRLVEEARKFQAQLSQGTSLQFWGGLEHIQIQEMMKAVVEKSETVEFRWDDIFSRDPIQEIDRKEPFIVSVNFDPSEEELKKRQGINKSIAQDWEAIRKEAIKRKESYSSRLELEFGGKADAIEHVMFRLAKKTVLKQEISTDEYSQAIAVVGSSLAWWETYSGKQDALKEVLAFYRSPEYRLIPFADVSTRLLSELTTGNEEIHPSDVMDIHQIATVLPYATYIVADKRIRNRIESKKTGLAKDYPVTFLKWQEVLPLLEKLSDQ
jgi:hypothetical protein